MSRSRAPLRALAAASLVVVALCCAACSGSPSTVAGTTRSSTAPTTRAVVVIRDFTYHPDRITVTPGAAIRVVNEDQVTHTFTADGGEFSTGDLAPGASVTVTAPTRTGSYPYRCTIHQFMTGDVVVRS